MRYDWYQATVPEDPSVIIGELLHRLAPEGSIEEGHRMHNYHFRHTVRTKEGDAVAMILSGGPNGDPNVTGSGEGCPRFVETIRELWPVHRVTRLDACEDFGGEGAYEALEEACKAITARMRVKGRSIVPDDVEDGRAYYMGAPTSDVRARLYDKAAELRTKVAPDRLAAIPQHLARLEAQVRPRKDMKVKAASWSPADCWGASGWTQQVAREALSLDLERIMMQAGIEPQFARTKRFMVMQYGRMLRRMLDEHGSWAAVGVEIGAELVRAEAYRRRK